MKSLVQIYEKVLHDLENLCKVRTSRDLKTISARIKHEGLSFATITLPAFAKGFERCLELELFDPSLFVGWASRSKRRNRDMIPAFLQGFMKGIFDPRSGRLHDAVDPNYVYAIRQVCLLAKKFEAECTPQRVRKALDDYIICDLEVASVNSELPEYKYQAITELAGCLFAPVLDGLEEQLRVDTNIVVCKHGPGTTADGTLANAKYDYLTWTRRLESLFPACYHLLPSWNAEDRFMGINFLDPEQEPPVRVVTVPKTLKTPRIIAIEPVHMQYVQQGLMEHLIPLLEGKVMFGSLGFTDQSVSQNMALTSSSDRRLATLDLSEASDRVSYDAVYAMLSRWPLLRSCVMASRSTHASVDGHGVIRLSKFASMGSALCFPIEAMLFLTIIGIAGCDGQVPRTRWKFRKELLSSVRVYGDDIVVPVDMALIVVRELESFGLKVNTAKSFWKGKFRESCGGDFYDGVTVKPLYLHTSVPESRQSAREIESSVSFRNLAYKAGLWTTAAYYDKMIERFAPFPLVTDTSPVLGRVSFLGLTGQERLCSKLHRPLVLGMVPKKTIPRSPLSDQGALMKFFLKRGSDPIFAKDHLDRAGRPKNVAINLRWASAV